jgi:primosomal protein N' (replication factor Y)
MRVADVVFDVPVPHPFTYRLPDALTLTPGQRVRAPLRGGPRVGLVVAVRETEGPGLKAVMAVVDRAPVLAPAQLALAQWISRQSLSSLGSTIFALLPPPDAAPVADDRDVALADGNAARTSPAGGEGGHPGERAPRAAQPQPELLVGHGRERRVLERIAATGGPALVVVPDIDGAARWAARLAKLGPVVRLDSGAEGHERAEGWRALAAGRARLAVGTRSALLAPLAVGAYVALIDEHETAHKPPGPPRIHARDVMLERARREPIGLVFTSATPSVETWWRADASRIDLASAPVVPWPVVSVADTRRILRREPITPELARAMREALGAGRRVFLGVSRLTAALACDECGAMVRCETCALALAYARGGVTMSCRLCGAAAPVPEVCPTCHGRRLSPFGWSPERVEHAVRRRFPKVSVARYDPDAGRGARLEAQRRAAAHADVVVGTRGALRLFGPASLGVAGFVSPDHLLRLPDFRASERMFATLWAAAERVRADGAVVVQSQNPEHYALAALGRHDLRVFYREELKFRGELGYPPFRRLAIVTATGTQTAEVETMIAAATAALRGARGVTVYPPMADRRGRARRVVVKGGDDLPDLLEAALSEFRRPRPRSRGIMDVEVDPVEWPF